MKRGILALAFGVMEAVFPSMNAAEVDSDAWVTRSFWVSSNVLSEYLPDETSMYYSLPGSLKGADSKPKKDVQEEELIAFLKEHSHSLKQSFKDKLAALPEGSVVAYDAKNQTLAMRTTVEGLQWAEQMEKTSMDQVERLVVLRFEVIETDTKTVWELLERGMAEREHSEIREHLMTLVEEGKAVVRTALRQEIRSGQRGVMEQAREIDEVKAVQRSANGEVISKREPRLVGTRLEVDPVLSSDARRMDVNYVLHHDPTEPVRRMERVGIANGLETPVWDGGNVESVSSETFKDGEARILGVWSMQGKPGVMQLAMLRCSVVLLLDCKVNRELEGILAKYADRVEKIPEGGKQVKPKAMMVREFTVPPDFLTVDLDSTGEVAADPFAVAVLDEAEKKPRKIHTAKKVLESAGVSFPEGAAAVFSPKSGKLWVRNTAPNLELIEGYVYTRHSFPVTLNGVVRVVEAEGKLIRQLMEDSAESGNHSELWDRMQKGIDEGKVLMVDALRLGCRSGMRVKCDAGLMIGGFEIEESGGGVVNATLKHRKAGVYLEMDPVLGPDGVTMDVNLAFEFHHAKPLINSLNSEKEFRYFKTTTSFAIESGKDRLLGVWKREGMDVDGDRWQAAFLRMDCLVND